MENNSMRWIIAFTNAIIFWLGQKECFDGIPPVILNFIFHPFRMQANRFE